MEITQIAFLGDKYQYNQEITVFLVLLKIARSALM